jgi:hypothetical protein
MALRHFCAENNMRGVCLLLWLGANPRANPDAIAPHERGFLAYVFESLSKEALRQVLGGAETEGLA